MPPDSPTPVPMPPTGAGSNTVVSNQGDTIELVIHSPHKGTANHLRPSGWLGGSDVGDSGGRGDGSSDRGDFGVRHDDPLPPLSLKHGEEDGSKRGHRHQATTATSTPSSIDYDDVLSILSASELVVDDLVTEAPGPSCNTNIERASSGRLADAFSDKWGAWVQEARSSDNEPARSGESELKHERNGGSKNTSEKEGTCGDRSAPGFHHEALLQNPFEPNLGTAPAAAVVTESEGEIDNRAAPRLSRSSSSDSVYDEKKWLWRRRDGVLPPTSSSDGSTRASSRAGSTVADWPEQRLKGPAGLEGGVCNNSARGGDSSSEKEREGATTLRYGSSGEISLDCEIQEARASATTHTQGQEQVQQTSGGATTTSLLEIDI